MLRGFTRTVQKAPRKFLTRTRHTTQQTRNLNSLRVGVVKEVDEGELRVVITPTNVAQLTKAGATVSVEKGAGINSGFSDALFEEQGATIVSGDEVWKQDVVLKMRTPTPEMISKLENRTLINQLGARFNKELVDQLSQQGATCFDLSMLLRTLSRGQTFDVISSQANMAGYRAVVEAGNILQRPFAGQMTAAGKIPPTRVMVVGAGVAGLAAIQTAKNLGAIVTSFDVRSAAAEQVESMGAQFLKVEFEEDGSGAGGYAKEMSAEWFEAADKMLLKEMEKTNVIITTALIPGRAAPVLIKKHHTDAMPHGSVIVDLAAETGGNCEITEANKVVEVNGVTAIGYTNMPSRLSTTSSTLFGNNVTKYLLSMSKEGEYVVDLEGDEAVRSMCIVHKGKKLEEYVPPPPEVDPAAEAKAKAAEEEEAAVDPKAETMTSARNFAIGGSVATALGAGVPNAPMLSTFALSVWVGSGAVQGVSHALHSPLMSVTNAISGTTIIGGMLQLSGGIVPYTGAGVLATTAVTLSAVNLAGGFMVTEKMLDLFRRPDDPEEYWHYYYMPFGVIGGGYALAKLTGTASASLTPTVALISGLGCIGGIAALSSQETARAGVTIGSGAVGLGVLAALGSMDCSPAVYGQLALFSALGLGVGHQVAARIEPTSLPQAVAGFHCLVGIAATSTAVGDFLTHDMSHMDGFHSAAIYLGAWMGSITFTGSVVAAGKLAEYFDTSPMQLNGRDYINMGLGSTTGLAMLGFMGSSSPAVAGTALGYGVLSSGLLGWHMTASIGGADMPVVVTLLNSYSGWALCAEGFILDQPVLTIVGALIGSSGAFLTKIMCDGMNRDLTGVISGGFGTEAGAVQTAEGLVHTEVDSAGATQAMLDAQKIMITPGYGLAVAQAQQVVAQIATKLKSLGKDVTFGVHPVAGRMPGQLNVLLAEAGVPYDIVYEMEEVNEEMADTNVALVVGANDTVNCLAEDDPNCAIGGMPVIQVWNAEQVLFMKRSMASGYAGVDNPVFYKDNTDMWLGDAKKSLEEMQVILADH
jgi:H+-translocating NAD(P) transhydrogenase